MSIKRLFLLLILCWHELGQAQWIKIHETLGMSVYADMQTMLAPKDNRIGTFLMDFKGPNDDDLASTITVQKFDCEKHLRLSMSGEHFSENMGQGKPNFVYTSPLRWKKVEIGDGWESVFELICGKRPSLPQSAP